MRPDRTPSTFRLLAAIVTVQVLFAIHYPASKILVGSFPPLIWATLRALGGTILLFAFALLFRRKSSPRITGKFLGQVALFSLLGNVFNQAGFIMGMKYTTATNSGILNTSVPVFTLLIAWATGHERLKPRHVAALLIAACGVLLVIGKGDAHFGTSTLRGDVLTLANAFSHATFLVLARPFLMKHDRAWATAWLFASGTVGIALLAGPEWKHFTFPQPTPALLAAGIFTVVGATFVTYLLLNWVLAHWPASRVSMFVYLQPILATWLSAWWLHEGLTERTVVGSLLLFAGVGLALTPASYAARLWRYFRKNSISAPSEGTR